MAGPKTVIHVSMKERHSIRVRAGVLILIVSGLIYAVETCRRAHVFTSGPADATEYSEGRLSELRKRLPARGVVGYVTDAPDDEKDRSFYRTQYSLSPIIVERTTETELVVGDFKDRGAASEVASENNLLLLEDFGQGVVLFKQK